MKTTVRISHTRARVSVVVRDVSEDIEEVAFEMDPEKARLIADHLAAHASAAERFAEKWPALRLVKDAP